MALRERKTAFSRGGEPFFHPETLLEFDRIGKYQILGEIGRGTMGRVFRGLDPALNRPVAVKTLSLNLGVAQDARERFRREAQAAALLSHPNIVTVYEFGEEHGHIYMAMEFLEGIDLRSAISEGLLPALSDKLRVMDQVLAGLAFAHSKGVVHRDLKPANVHIQPTGQVKILDFGLARVGTAEITQAGVVMGTPNYMAPEQALGDRVDSRADVFAVGAVFYELLSGRKPFDADTTPAVLFQVVHKAHKRLVEAAPRVPPILAEVVEKALDKNRDNRFNTARQMRAALAVARTAIDDGRGQSSLADESRRALVSASGSHAVVRPTDSGPVPAGVGPLDPGSGPVGGSLPGAIGIAPRRPGRWWRLVAATLGVALAAASAAWILWRPTPPQPPTAEDLQVRALTAALVSSEIELAQEALADKRYAKAEISAQKALNLDPQSTKARTVLEEARSRISEVEGLAAQARTALDGSNVEEASAALSRLLEIDPTAPAVSELTSRLNSAFQARAVEAEGLMKQSRQTAETGGAGGSADYATGVTLVRSAERMSADGEHAEAARAFLEARDSFDRGLRTLRSVRRARASDAVAPVAGATVQPAVGEAHTAPTGPLPVEPVVPERRFSTTRTMLASESRGAKPEGFDTSDVKVQKAPNLVGRIDFEIEPATPRNGDSIKVRVFFTNEGRKSARLRSVVLNVNHSGERIGARSVTPLVREVKPQSRKAVAEWTGTLPMAAEVWSLETVVGSESNETAQSRLSWQ